MGVELQMGPGVTVRIRWAMTNFNEAITLRRHTRHNESDGLKMINVSDAAEWRLLLGEVITEAAATWHVPNEYATETVWSIRLAFGKVGSVVIALGECDYKTRRISYIPDSLVVIFDEVLAREYEPPASIGSSWGSLIATI